MKNMKTFIFISTKATGEKALRFVLELSKIEEKDKVMENSYMKSENSAQSLCQEIFILKIKSLFQTLNNIIAIVL